jgi:transcriptional regulator with XRE-family HTH domain
MLVQFSGLFLPYIFKIRLFGLIQNKRDMENDVKQRIMDLIEIKADSVYAFSKQIKVAQTTLSEYLNNGKRVSFTIIRAILEAYPDVSAEWLLRGTGESCFIEERDIIDTPTAQDDEALISAKATITRLNMENETLKKQIIELRAIMEYQEKRLDKFINILHEESNPSPSLSIVAEEPTYTNSNNLK